MVEVQRKCTGAVTIGTVIAILVAIVALAVQQYGWKAGPPSPQPTAVMQSLAVGNATPAAQDFIDTFCATSDYAKIGSAFKGATFLL